MGFSKQEGWNGLPFPSPGDLPDPGIELTSPVSPVLQVDSLPLSHSLGKPHVSHMLPFLFKKQNRKAHKFLSCL